MTNSPIILIDAHDAGEPKDIEFNLMSNAKFPAYWGAAVVWRDVEGEVIEDVETIDGTVKLYGTNIKHDADSWVKFAEFTVNSEHNKLDTKFLPIRYPFIYFRLVYAPNHIISGTLFADVFVSDK